MGATAYLSWRPAATGDAEWMFGKSRDRLAQALAAANARSATVATRPPRIPSKRPSADGQIPGTAEVGSPANSGALPGPREIDPSCAGRRNAAILGSRSAWKVRCMKRVAWRGWLWRGETDRHDP